MKNLFKLFVIVFTLCFAMSCSNDSNPAKSNEPVLKITTLVPENNAIKVNNHQSFQLEFEENVSAGKGLIKLYSKDGDKLIESLDIKSNAVFNKNKLSFSFATKLDFGKEYYINIDKGAILFAETKEFTGISDKNTWAFTVETPQEKENTIMTNLNIIYDKKINFLSDPENTGIDSYESGFYTFRGEMYPSSWESYTIEISFPINLKVHTTYDLSKKNGYDVYIYSSYTSYENYILQGGSLKLFASNEDYCEGEFEFTAIANQAKIMKATKGYFFTKFD